MAAMQQGPSKVAVLRPAAPADPVPGSQIRVDQMVTVGARSTVSERDSYSVTTLADITDRSLHAAIARFTAGMSPASLAEAYSDWLTHLTYAPGKRAQLMDKAVRKTVRFANYAGRYAIEAGKTESCIEPLPQDRRFSAEGWQKWPFNFIYQAFLL
jgi:polyhydroxyalkanoate synthase